MKHLIVDISAHGFGHLAQTAAVLNALDCSDTRLTLRSLSPEHILRERIKHPFELIRYQQDNGMVMHDALRIDATKTFSWYQDFHQNYAQRKREAANELERLQPDLVFADVPYLSLDAAGELGLSSVALCSLNWAGIFKAYCGHFAGAEQIHAEILHAYAQADIFLRATPAIPMTELSNTRAIAPLALLGKRRSERLHELPGCTGNTRFVLVALGGIGMNYPLDRWPVIENVCWIFPDAVLDSLHDDSRADFIAQSRFDWDYVDLLASCDLVLTKTGYGTQTEAVVNQVPALCVSRGDWPEQPYLFDWHQQHGEVEFIEWEDVTNPPFAEKVMAMLERKWIKPLVAPSGAQEAARVLSEMLGGQFHSLRFGGNNPAA